MAIHITRIDDKADGFTVEFTVVNTYKRTFPARDPGKDQSLYARESVQGLVTSPVEKPDGVVIKVQPVVAAVDENAVVDLDEPAPPIVPDPDANQPVP